MAGQLWQVNRGYMATPKLSKQLRFATQPLCRFTQFADVEVAHGKARGDTYAWNTYGDIKTAGGQIPENARMPTTTFTETQAQVVLKEYGNSVEYTGLYDELSEHPVKVIISKTLRNDAARTLDTACWQQFDSTILAARPTSATAFDWTDTGSFAGTASNDLTVAHVKGIVDFMAQDRRIPVFDGENYVCITQHRTLRPFLNDLESIAKYTEAGWGRIVDGEAGKFENMRFVRQSNVLPVTGQTGAGTTGASAYFFGADTVTEVFAEPLQIRGKIPDDYGRSQGIAWYYVGAFGITNASTVSAESKMQARIIKWRGK